MSTAWELVELWLGLTGLVGLIMMGFDKSRAVGGGWRIPEKTFFAFAFVGGTFGIILGSIAFHHKVRKLKFMLIILVAAAFWATGLYELRSYLGPLSLAVTIWLPSHFPNIF